MTLLREAHSFGALTGKQQVTLEIAGARYKMTSDAPEAHLKRLAEMINDRIAQLGTRAARTASPAQMLAVVALGLADDLLTSEEQRQQLEALTRRTIIDAIGRIDARLEADASGPASDEDGGPDGDGEAR